MTDSAQLPIITVPAGGTLVVGVDVGPMTIPYTVAYAGQTLLKSLVDRIGSVPVQKGDRVMAWAFSHTEKGWTHAVGVSINDGAQYTNDPDVTVFAVWPGFASDALVSNDGGFKTAVNFPVAEKIPWKLDSSGPERLPKTIYVRFTAGTQVSETYQDDIILDQTPPKVLSASLSSGGSAASAWARMCAAISYRRSGTLTSSWTVARR